MSITETNLSGVLCPYCITNVIKAVEGMHSGETNLFIVDDPLAIKAIPEELEEEDDLDITIEKDKQNWKVIIEKKIEKQLQQ